MENGLIGSLRVPALQMNTSQSPDYNKSYVVSRLRTGRAKGEFRAIGPFKSGILSAQFANSPQEHRATFRGSGQRMASREDIETIPNCSCLLAKIS
jgi:hypothetical protein